MVDVNGFFMCICHFIYLKKLFGHAIQPVPLAVKARSPDHWTTRKFPSKRVILDNSEMQVWPRHSGEESKLRPR